jgi:hypothetical protein
MIKKIRSQADDERISFHEAGHVTLGRQLTGVALGGVSIEGGDGFSGMAWGAKFDRSLKYSDVVDQVPTLYRQVVDQIPGVGESRAEIADLYLHIFHAVIELTGGTEAERLFCDGEPGFAFHDEKEAVHFVSLITSSSESGMALIAACRVEARSILTAQAAIVKALAAELIVRRTLDGEEIDEVISGAISARALKVEQLRRADWRARQLDSARFVKWVESGDGAVNFRRAM